MSLDQTIAALGEHPVFAALDRDALRILAFSSDRLELTPGTRLFAQGAPADAAYVLVSGTLELEQSRDGVSVSQGAVPEGALIGEIALLAQTNRPASAVARTPIEVLRIPRSVFRRLLEEYPRGAEELRKRLSERLLTLTRHLERVREDLARGLPAQGEEEVDH
jgi:CRP-like cAMP-binding protein